MREAYSLHQRLPSDVFGRVASDIASYKGYPVFSRPWFWRRALVFSPIALALSLVGGINVLVQFESWPLAASTFAVSLPAWLCIMLLGPALATAARHAQRPFKTEKRLIVLAIVCGVTVSMLGQYGADRYRAAVIEPRMVDGGLVTERALQVQQEIRRRPWVFIVNTTLQFAIFAALGGGIALRAYFNERRRWLQHEHERELSALRVQRDESERRLMVLQAQVEPHFLFNTLASVRSLIRTDADRAEATLDALVDHLRATLPKLRSALEEPQSTLAQQVEICRSYLAVMQVRMGERLICRVSVPEQLGRLAFPPLLLISLVENAIKHGAEPKRGQCTVAISARTRTEEGRPVLDVMVTDDGVGLRPDVSGGIGLANIRDQLAARFGSLAGLRLEATQEGVTATITVPMEQAVS